MEDQLAGREVDLLDDPERSTGPTACCRRSRIRRCRRAVAREQRGSLGRQLKLVQVADVSPWRALIVRDRLVARVDDPVVPLPVPDAVAADDDALEPAERRLPLILLRRCTLKARVGAAGCGGASGLNQMILPV